ncbi:MAG TPA: ATP-binding protein, partial [Burkholderiaceae bacterium]|nr:ATP-binding protein [Burkholderiaceae bacterium]
DRFCGSFKLYAPDGSPIPHAQCWMALALRDNAEYDGHEIVIERPDGSRCTVLAHANPFCNQRGEVIGAMNVLIDISERKRIEDALREADRNKSDFLAMLAHELRNPLAPIRNGLQVMRLAGNDIDTITQVRGTMERQLVHMVRLIDDLLDVSRIANGKIELRKEYFDITCALYDALETCRPLTEAAGHELRIESPAKPVMVHADRTRLAQVFGNLLGNSVKYTAQGGHIRVSVERHGTDAVVSIRDDGIGIATEMLPKIFDMFAQADRSFEKSSSGLGIGLSLVRGLIEMHGGTVEAYSKGAGKGAEFVVRLSVAAPLPDMGPLAAGSGSEAKGFSSKYRILVVDDNKDSAISLAIMLKIMGHELCTVHDGVEAVDAARTFRPDVILLDIGLPRLNGYEACRRIREQPWGARMVLIALTGWGHEEDKARSKEAGFNFHMVKPVDPDALEKLLSGLLLAPI